MLAFAMDSITMATSWRSPYMIGSLTTTPTSIGMVNLALLIAWLIPITLPIIATAFIGSYLGSIGWASISHRRHAASAVPQ